MNTAPNVLDEAHAQISALRKALERIKQGCVEDLDCWHKYPHLRQNVIGGVAGNRAIAEAALCTPPPPPCVPLEEARALANTLENLRDEQNGPPLERHKDHWQEAYDNASKIISQFATQHPL